MTTLVDGEDAWLPQQVRNIFATWGARTDDRLRALSDAAFALYLGDYDAHLDDLSDMALARGLDPMAVQAALANASERAADRSTGIRQQKDGSLGENPKPEETAVRFFLRTFDELTSAPIVEYAVKGLFPRRGLAIVWGPPKCGKSFWVFTVMMHVALGRDYRGHRVQKGEIVYLALEGVAGFADRATAFRQRFLDPDETVPAFNLCGTSLDLIKDHKKLIADIKQQKANPTAVILDTLNRSLVGSEGKDEDMAAYLRAAEAIQAAFNCLVVIIHHCGVSGDRPRGHTSQTGAADVQIAVKKDGAGNVIATVELAKDMAEGATFASRLEVVELGIDQDGDPITSCAVMPVDDIIVAKPMQKGQSMTKAAKIAHKALKLAITAHGVVPPADDHIPAFTKTVTIEEWREHAYKLGISTGEDRAQRKAFQTATTSLIGGGHAGVWDGQAWPL